MIKKIFYLFFFLFLFKQYAYSKGNDSIFHSGTIFKFSKAKPLIQFKHDTLQYLFPFLTIHLGVSEGLSTGSAIINSENSSGTKVDFKNDLGFPGSTLFPRVNINLSATKKAQFIFDINLISIKKSAFTPKDLRVGDLDLPANTSVKSNFSMFFTNLAYRHSIVGKKHFNFGGLLGLDFHQYGLKIRNNETGASNNKVFGVWTPFVGLEIYGFVHKNFFFRGTFNFTDLPFHNYNLAQLSFKSYIEYYIIKNVGFGVSYNYFYSDIRQLSKINGSLKYQINSVSIFASFRFY